MHCRLWIGLDVIKNLLRQDRRLALDETTHERQTRFGRLCLVETAALGPPVASQAGTPLSTRQTDMPHNTCANPATKSTE
jgi:hypothetical protein